MNEVDKNAIVGALNRQASIGASNASSALGGLTKLLKGVGAAALEGAAKYLVDQLAEGTAEASPAGGAGSTTTNSAEQNVASSTEPSGAPIAQLPPVTPGGDVIMEGVPEHSTRAELKFFKWTRVLTR
jgi:hypothetical protein